MKSIVRGGGLRRALTVLALGALACARDPSVGTPAAAAEGERLMRKMSETLAKAPTLRFVTEESLEPVAGSEGRLLRASRTLTVRRPNAMAFELKGSGDTPMDVAAVYDGSNVSLRDGRTGAWTQVSAPPTLDEMLDFVARQYSLPVPIADVVYSSPYDALVGRATTGGFAGRATIDGVECAQLEYSDPYVEVRLWIPVKGQPLPRRLELGYRQVPGAPKARIDFKSWDLAPGIAADAFTFPQGDPGKRIAFEQFTATLLSGGDPGSLTPPVGSAPGGPDPQ